MADEVINTPIIDGKEVVLEVDNIDITFGSGKNLFKAVSGASFNIYKGETFSLVGESGSGKTTIGRAIVRINPLSKGEIRYKGKRIFLMAPLHHHFELKKIHESKITTVYTMVTLIVSLLVILIELKVVFL